MTNSSTANHYQAPGWVTRMIFNRAVARLTRMGISVWGARVLEVPGRTSGAPRTTPVNLLTVDGTAYLVAARGETQWVRNVRAADGHLTLIKGRRREAWTASEIHPDAELGRAEAVTVLRAYLRRWKAEVGAFFEAGPDASDEELAAILLAHPIFRLAPAA